jgi:hypothetical protein
VDRGLARGREPGKARADDGDIAAGHGLNRGLRGWRC